MLHDQVIVKQIMMNNYRININELLDSDEEWIYENEHFRAIIKKIKDEFEYLVNPIFDVEEAIQNISPEVSKKYKTPDDGYFPMNQADLILIFSQTFNAPRSARHCF
jgi:hypothetical protein